MEVMKMSWRPKDWSTSKILRKFYTDIIKLSPQSIVERDTRLIEISADAILKAISREIVSRNGEKLDSFIYTLYSISNKGDKD